MREAHRPDQVVSMRSSDAIGAGARPEPVKSKWPRFQRILMQREKTPAELNYLAQFLYLDTTRPPIGGHRRKTGDTAVLDAVSWQQKAIEKAAQVCATTARLAAM